MGSGSSLGALTVALILGVSLGPGCASGGRPPAGPDGGGPPRDAPGPTMDVPVLTDAACGGLGGTCCAGDMCSPGLMCTGGRCIGAMTDSGAVDAPGTDGGPPCGIGVGALCCAGAMCDAPLVCNGVNRCTMPGTDAGMCGTPGRPCCSGGTCTAPALCTLGMCTTPPADAGTDAGPTCGLVSQPCCVGSMCSIGLECFAGSCRTPMPDAGTDAGGGGMCGFLLLPCCQPGNFCIPPFMCATTPFGSNCIPP